MYFYYDNIFTPSYRDENSWLDDFEFEYKDLPTQELLKKYRHYEEYLYEIRLNEPPRKRGRKSDYRLWISRTQDILELLSAIAEELRSRGDLET